MGTSGGISFGAGTRKLLLSDGELGASRLRESLEGTSSVRDSLRSSPGVRGLLEDGLSDLWLLLSRWLSLPLLPFLSSGGMIGFDGVVSLPIALHVCANNANGLFLESNCNIQNKHLTLIKSIFSCNHGTGIFLVMIP